jgi:hypothetical protein
MAAPIVVPRRREDFFNDKGDPTLRFIKFLESLTEVSNTQSNDIESNNFNSSFSANIQWLEARLDGLPELTIDTSGFTTDTTFITTDKVIA